MKFTMKRIIQTLLFVALSVQFAVAQPPKWLDKAKRSVFSIVTYGSEGQTLHSGNGFFVTEAGVGVSNYELFKGAAKAEIITSDGKRMPIESILGVNEMYDVIKFKVGITDKKVPALTIAAQPSEPDATVYLLPYSTQKERTFRSGKVKEVSKIGENYNYYTLDLLLTEKQASCPVTNVNGDVIGLTQYGSEENKLCYAVGVNFIMAQEISPLSLNSSSLRNIGIRKGLPDDEDSAMIFLFLASSQLSSEDYLELLNDFIAQYPTNPDGYIRRANAMAYQGKSTADFDKSAADFAKALSVATDKQEVYYALAKQIYQYRLNNSEIDYTPWTLDTAAGEINKAIALENVPVYYQLAGDIQFANGNYAGAYEWYDKVNQTDLVSATTFFNAAKAKELAGGDAEEVIAILDSCVARTIKPLNEEEAPYLLERAQQLMIAKKYRQAVVDYDAYFTAVNGQVNDLFYYLREQATLNARQFQRALDDITMAIELNPEETTYQLELAVINLRIGRYAEAEKLLQNIIDEDAEYAEAYRILGITQVQQNHKDDACKSFAKAKELGDENVDDLIEKHCK